jgi:hypothetical protein
MESIEVAITETTVDFVGSTVKLKFIGEPSQPAKVGVTAKRETIGEFVELEARTDEMVLKLPDSAIPVFLFELVQVNEAPIGSLVNVNTGDGFKLQTVSLDN